MPQDLFTLKRAVKEVNQKITGAKINKVFMPSAEEINLLIYNGETFRLVISVKAEFARVSLSKAEKQNPETAYNFCMLLRKHLTGGKILGASVFNDDRTVKISILSKNEFFDDVIYDLYAEIMGKYSNLFLTENGIILSSIKRAVGIDGERVTLPGVKYTPYKKSEKLALTEENLNKVFNNFKGDVYSLLQNNFYEFSPATLTEISYRVENSNNTPLNVVTDFINQKTSPTVIRGEKRADFYPFNYESIKGERKNYSSLCEAMESALSSIENENYLNSMKNAVNQSVKSYEKRLIKRLSNLNDTVLKSKDYQDLKLYGELIISNAYRINKGLKSVTLPAYFEDGEKNISIPLDETLTPNQNAQNYFRKYRKLKTAIELSSTQIKDTEEELNYINFIKFSLSQAENKSDINEIKEELINNKIIKDNKAVNKKKQPKNKVNYKKFNVLGVEAWLGRNGIQNDKILSLAERNDLWFHVKKYHSSHLIVKTNGKNLTENLIKIFAEICANYSQAGKGEKVEVDYTFRRFVKKRGGKNLGGVFYTDYSTVTVIPSAHDEFLIK